MAGFSKRAPSPPRLGVRRAMRDGPRRSRAVGARPLSSESESESESDRSVSVRRSRPAPRRCGPGRPRGQEVAQAEGVDHLLGAGRAVGGHLQAEAQAPRRRRARPPARTAAGRSRRCGRSAGAGCRASGRAARKSASGAAGVVAAIGRDVQAVADRLGLRGAAGAERPRPRAKSRPGRRLLGQASEHLGRLHRLGQLQLHDLAAPLDPQGQGQGEDDLRAGVEPLVCATGSRRGGASAPGSASGRDG